MIWLAAESLVKDQAKLGPNIGESWSVSNVYIYNLLNEYSY